MIKVLIAEDLQPLLRRYKAQLQKDSELEVVAAVQSGYDAVMMAGMHQPDVVLMDIEMESRTAGLDATRQILARLPNTKIVILTVYEDDETVFAAFQLGVSDYVLKNAAPAELITCVKDAYHNRSPIRPVIAEKIRQEFQRVKKREDSFLYSLHLVTQLTQTEVDVLDLMNKGYSRQQICEIRFVEMSTVKTQIRSILKKFDKASMQEVLEMLNGLDIFEYLHNMRQPPVGKEGKG